MKKIILIGFLSFSGIVLSQNEKLEGYSWLKNSITHKIEGQDYVLADKVNKGIKEITIKINGAISEQQFLNRKGFPYYIKNSFGIRYYEYDKRNRIIKYIYVNPGGGFECNEITYFKKTAQNYSYINQDEINYESQTQNKLKKEVDSISSSNNIAQDVVMDGAYAIVEPDSVYYRYLKEINLITNPKTLLNSPSLKRLIKHPKFISFSAEFNSELKKGSETYFDLNHKITSFRTFDYLPKKTIVKYNGTVGNGEIIKELDDSGNILTEVEGDKTISYEYENGKCIQKKQFKNGVLVGINTYLYKDKLLMKELYKDVVNDDEFISVLQYENNILINKIDTSKYAKNIYKYEYAYY